MIEARRSRILRLLTRKVGAIPDLTLTKINTLSIDQLEALSEALLDFGSIDDLTAWLENQGYDDRAYHWLNNRASSATPSPG